VQGEKYIESLRVLKSFRSKCWKIVKATRITNSTEEPLKEAPAKTKAHVLYKAMDFLSVKQYNNLTRTQKHVK
jgi:hypothetical protein